MQEKQGVLIEQSGKDGLIKDQSGTLNENVFSESSIIDDKVEGMENFILQKYSQITDLQKYLVDQLRFIQQSKAKHTSINKLIGNKILPALKEFQDTVGILKTILQPFFSISASYVQAVASKCKDLLEQKEQKYLNSQRELKQLKEQNKQLKSRLQANDIKQTSVGNRTVIKKDSKVQAEKYDMMNKQNLEENNKERVVTASQKYKQISKNNPYLLTSPPIAQRQRSPLNVLPQNQTFQARMEGSPNFNKTISISYRCQRFKNQTLSPSKSVEKLNPSKSTEKIIAQKVGQDCSRFPLCNRKDFIKQKIQNLKQKNEIQFRQHYPRMK